MLVVAEENAAAAAEAVRKLVVAEENAAAVVVALVLVDIAAAGERVAKGRQRRWCIGRRAESEWCRQREPLAAAEYDMRCEHKEVIILFAHTQILSNLTNTNIHCKRKKKNL